MAISYDQYRVKHLEARSPQRPAAFPCWPTSPLYNVVFMPRQFRSQKLGTPGKVLVFLVFLVSVFASPRCGTLCVLNLILCACKAPRVVRRVRCGTWRCAGLRQLNATGRRRNSEGVHAVPMIARRLRHSSRPRAHWRRFGVLQSWIRPASAIQHLVSPGDVRRCVESEVEPLPTRERHTSRTIGCSHFMLQIDNVMVCDRCV